MKALSSTGVAISLVSALLVLALLAELYYLLCWKKKKAPLIATAAAAAADAGPAKELLYLFCWKKPSSLTPTALNPRDTFCEEEEGVDVELMRLHSLSGPPRFLFTIREETKEDLELPEILPNSKGRTLRDFLANAPAAETPASSPVAAAAADPAPDPDTKSESGPPPPSSSPLPKLKFLRDAEEKLCRKNNQVNPLPNSQ